MAQQRSFDEVVNEEKQKKCPECGSEEVVYEKGEVYCKKCGFVLSD